jgi:hypothetical protein
LTAQVYEPVAEAVVIFVVLLLIVKFKVDVCTQPAAFNDVALYVPLVLYATPFAAHVYESHATFDDDEDDVLLIVKFKFSVFKHPDAFNDVYVYAPLALYATPFAAHVYESHEVCVEVDVELLLIVKFNVSVFKHPAAFNDVFVYAPLALYVTPFAPQVYESQDEAFIDDDELLLIVKFNVAVFTQPAAFNDVFVYAPLAVYVTPLAAQV